MPIIRRNNCIYATLDTCYSVWMTGMHTRQSNVFIRHLALVILYRWLSGVHTRQSSIQNSKYQVSHKFSCFSWWWAHSRPKQVEKINRHTKKNCAPSWLYLKDEVHTFRLLLLFLSYFIFFLSLFCFVVFVHVFLPRTAVNVMLQASANTCRFWKPAAAIVIRW